MSWREAARCGVLLAAVLAAFREALFAGRVFYERDILNYWYPHVEVFVRTLAAGALPLWNPHVGFGAPLLADPNFGFLYPPTWLNLVLDPATYYTLFVVGHCFFAALGAVLLARHLGLGPDAALLSGAVYGLGGPLLSAASLFHHFAGAAWMPWVLLGLGVALRSPSPRAALRLGAAAGLQLLAGSGDVCLMTAMAGVFLAFAREDGAGRSGPRGLLRALPCLSAAAALALGLAAVQWLPTAHEILASDLASRRGGSLYWSLHPASLIDTLGAGLVSRLPLAASVRAQLYEGREPLLASIYWGPVALVLAALALAMPGRGRRLLGIGLLVFLVAALGRHTPLGALVAHGPGLSLIRYPTKYLWGAHLCLALLAGMGLAALAGAADEPARRRLRGVGFGAAALGVVALLAAGTIAAWPALLAPWTAEGSRAGSGHVAWEASAVGASLVIASAALLCRAGGRGLWPLALALLATGDLVRAAAVANRLGPQALVRARPALLETLRAAGEARVFSAPPPREGPVGEVARGPEGWPRAWSRALGEVERLAPPNAARWGLFGSFDGDFVGLAPPAYSLLTALVVRDQHQAAAARILAQAGVDYVVSLDPGVFGGLPEVARADSVYPGPIRLSRVEDPLPRAFVVSGARVLGPAAVVGALAGLDSRRVVLLEGEGRDTPAVPGFVGSARVVARRADRLSVEAELSHPGYLVVLEAHHPGWRGTVDARPAPVLRANALFRAIALPAGRHQVEMRFRPPAAGWGLGVTAATLLALVLGKGAAFLGIAGRSSIGST